MVVGLFLTRYERTDRVPYQEQKPRFPTPLVPATYEYTRLLLYTTSVTIRGIVAKAAEKHGKAGPVRSPLGGGATLAVAAAAPLRSIGSHPSDPSSFLSSLAHKLLYYSYIERSSCSLEPGGVRREHYTHLLVLCRKKKVDRRVPPARRYITLRQPPYFPKVG